MSNQEKDSTVEKTPWVLSKEEESAISLEANKDVQELLGDIEKLFKLYRDKESILKPKHKELVLRRVLSFWVANWSYPGSKVSVYITDEMGSVRD